MTLKNKQCMILFILKLDGKICNFFYLYAFLVIKGMNKFGAWINNGGIEDGKGLVVKEGCKANLLYKRRNDRGDRLTLNNILNSILMNLKFFFFFF